MSQLSLYIPEQDMELLKRDASNADTTLSKYVAGLVREAAQDPGWPVGYWTEVYGSLKDSSFAVPEEVDIPLDDIQL